MSERDPQKTAGCTGMLTPMPLTTSRIVVCPDPINQEGFAASVWHTSNDGATWGRGGTSHAQTAAQAEQDARHWLLHDQDDDATTITVPDPRVLEDPRALGPMLAKTLPSPCSDIGQAHGYAAHGHAAHATARKLAA